MTKGDGLPCSNCGSKEWYVNGNCAPCTRARTRKKRNEDPIKEREDRRRRRKNNPIKERERQRKWQKDHPEERVAQNHRYRTRKTAAGGFYTVTEWKALVEHYGGKCLCCGRDDVKLTADHVIPVAKGGGSNIDNIQPLCQFCNSRKNDKIIDYRPNNGLGRWIQRKLFG